MGSHPPSRKTTDQPKRVNLLCNFRAPDLEHQQKWKCWEELVWDLGWDVCARIFFLIEADMKALQGVKAAASQIRTGNQVINIQQQNTFFYNPGAKSRREPLELNCSRSEFARTISSSMAEAYVMEKARDLNRSFCFRDFGELKPESFRKIVMRLRKRGKIVALPMRTNPRLYVLAERISEYPLTNENTRVKPWFTGGMEGGISGMHGEGMVR